MRKRGLFVTELTRKDCLIYELARIVNAELTKIWDATDSWGCRVKLHAELRRGSMYTDGKRTLGLLDDV